ncbi:hypothetical protein TELCIR_19447 [Teladorsagia circumcincta]|uniref:SXP/RAL-2 family protein Ani s 5-like cation-binding domain-containing protein n=1 Tax=Teladorsagia circumcincta TaxID=45464 RepID=A0A2G9TNP7_TELCI|nr:hypothetical protein TELCIR_19447 [Teladorsagia circumcincta]
MKTALIVFVFATVVASGIARRHGGHGHHHRPPLPPYLKNVSVEARRDYLRIIFNDTLTVAEQNRMIEDWAKTNKIAVSEAPGFRIPCAEVCVRAVHAKTWPTWRQAPRPSWGQATWW